MLSMNQHTVGLVHPFPIYRAGLAQLLAGEGYRVAFAVGSLAEAEAECLAAGSPEIVIAADRLDDGRGSELTASASVSSHVLLLAESVSAYVLDEAQRSGCAGLIAKSDHGEVLRRALTAITAGKMFFPAKSGMRQLTRSTQLTDRELELLMLLADGSSVKTIAQRLNLSVHTVRNHVRAILRKMNASTQLEAVLRAHALGLVQLHAEA